MGGGSAPKTPKPVVPVSYRKEAGREGIKSGSNRRALGSQYLQSRKSTPSGGGFGGTKQTLG